jgi:hypothetical protein
MASIFTRERTVYYCTALLVSALLAQVFAVIRDREIGGDFAAFYAEGKVAIKYPHRELYNLELQDKEYSSLIGSQVSSPVPYAPWFTIILAIFALLPYHWAFAVATCLSVALLIRDSGLRRELWGCLFHGIILAP